MIKLIGVSKTFNPGTIMEKKALIDVNLELREGDFVTVIGGNGAGKSTLLNLIAGVSEVDSGRILFDGIDVTDQKEHTRAAPWPRLPRPDARHRRVYGNRGEPRARL